MDLRNSKPALAPIDGSPIRKAVFVPADRPYQMCVRCVMDTTDPTIVFDEDGVCNHCAYFENNVLPVWFPNENGRQKLTKKINQIREYGNGKEYDCIIGLSGGIDSSFVATQVVEWGLRPLAVHVDAGWNSEIAVKNIEEIVSRLKIDLITHVVDWSSMRTLQRAFLHSNLANQDVPQDHAFFAALYGYAIKANVKYVISGSNFATESVLPQSWGHNAMDVAHVKAVHAAFGDQPLKDFPLVSFFDLYIRIPRIRKMEVFSPLNFMRYNKDDAIRILEKDYGWRYYGGKHYESRWTHFFQGYYLPHKFGYDKRKAHLSSLILAGQRTRDEALEELRQPLYSENQLKEDKAFIAKKLNLKVEELDHLIHEDCTHFSEFGNNEEKLRKLSARAGIVRAASKRALNAAKNPFSATRAIARKLGL